MRLNLGEVALSLGCGPGMVIWDGPSTGPAGARGPEPAPLTLKGLARKRAGNAGAPSGPEQSPAAHCWENDPWTNIFANGAQVDSRKVLPGNLFFCLPGEKADGHDFARDAAKAGACAIIAERNPFLVPGGEAEAPLVLPPVFLVDNVRRALWRLAMCHRDTSLARVIGVTGTAGKTSVKEVLAQVLEVRGRTERNHMNLNNQIGLPISMLNASADASFWVLELGISEAHDMDELGLILRPDLGVILNVGAGHLAGLGELGVAANKARLLDYILPGGVAVVSADYPDLTEEVEKRHQGLERRGIQCLYFSATRSGVASRADYLGPAAGGAGLYEVVCDNSAFEVATPFRGDFGSENVAAIVAVADKLGLSHEEIRQGFSLAKLPDQRFCRHDYGDFTLLDDSYNANPLSSKRMVLAAADMAREGGQPLILVMGEMLELGDIAASAHKDLGESMAQAAPLAVFWKGGHADDVLAGLRNSGYRGLFSPVAGGQDFALLLEEFNLQSALALFKGSRGNHLEYLVDIFRSKVSPAGDADAL